LRHTYSTATMPGTVLSAPATCGETEICRAASRQRRKHQTHDACERVVCRPSQQACSWWGGGSNRRHTANLGLPKPLMEAASRAVRCEPAGRRICSRPSGARQRRARFWSMSNHFAALAPECSSHAAHSSRRPDDKIHIAVD